MAVQIITDSTSDLGFERAKKWDIEILPLSVCFGHEELLDGVEITLDEFYERLMKSTVLPTTAQINPDLFYDAFKKHTDEGKQVVAVLISGVLSGTLQSAIIARDMLPEVAQNIYIVDSYTACLALGALVLEAAKMRDKGLSAPEITEQLEKIREGLVLYAMVDDLKYLMMGGRLSKAGKFLGGLLGIKPIIYLNHNVIMPIGKVRGTAKGCEWLLDKMKHEQPDMTKELFVGHSHAPEKLQQLLATPGAEQMLSLAEQAEIGPTIGVHAGPGCLSIAYFTEAR